MVILKNIFGQISFVIGTNVDEDADGGDSEGGGLVSAVCITVTRC